MAILEQHNKKKAEYEEWLGVVRSYLDEKDAEARKLIVEYEKAKKRTARVVVDQPLMAESQIDNLKVRRARGERAWREVVIR